MKRESRRPGCIVLKSKPKKAKLQRPGIKILKNKPIIEKLAESSESQEGLKEYNQCISRKRPINPEKYCKIPKTRKDLKGQIRQ